MFFDRHKQTPVQTIEEAESYNIGSKKEWDRTNSNQNSFSNSHDEDKLFDKITDKIREKDLNSDKQISNLKEDLEDQENHHAVSSFKFKHFKKDRLEPKKRDLSGTHNTEAGGTPQLIKGKLIILTKPKK